LKTKVIKFESLNETLEFTVYSLTKLMEEYHESELKKLRVADVSGRSEQLVCTFCGINPITEICKHPKVCSTKEKLKQTN
jgi:hypothetical protein